MTQELPLYYGFDPTKEHIHLFLSAFEQFVIVERVDTANTITLLRRALMEPASAIFEAALVPGTVGGCAQENVVGNAQEQDIIRLRNYEACKTWLHQRFFGEEEQENLRNAITEMRQRATESPRKFYSHIVIEIVRAGYDQEQQNRETERVFRQGLQPDIKMHIKLQPRQNLNDTVNAAQRYWDAYHPASDEILTRQTRDPHYFDQIEPPEERNQTPARHQNVNQPRIE